jgi:hypothetical protein
MFLVDAMLLPLFRISTLVSTHRLQLSNPCSPALLRSSSSSPLSVQNPSRRQESALDVDLHSFGNLSNSQNNLKRTGCAFQSPRV